VLLKHNTEAFLLIRNDTVLYEYYRKPSTANDLHPSYSIAKSFVSALTGIAVSEGFIKNINDPVTTYLPELNYKPEFEKLSIKHLLNHTSGIRYSLSQDARLYYGRDVWKAIRKIEFETTPGTKQSYLNINSQLLGLVLERATGKSAASYLEEKIWKPAGMENTAFWSTDSKGTEKTFCCLNATARDYAKFARLYLNKGNWQGETIISSEWITQSLAQDTAEGSSYGYNFSWHRGLDNYNDFMAIGLYKQHIYVNPAKNMIIVLLNHKENKLKAERVNWWYIFRQIADRLD
jgi:CubicO group peptidase (beta-lactamase class C family)